MFVLKRKNLGVEKRDLPDRVFSRLVVKAIDEDERVVEGVASTGSTDRDGDIVEPDGAQFKLPLPLLWQHDHRQPIGEVFEAKVVNGGIAIKARLVKMDDGPSQLRARLDEAWASIKTGLVRGLSIGFRAIEYSFLEEGVRFIKWAWVELSAVTVPANEEATITAIKSYAAALGNKRKSVKRKGTKISAGVSALFNKGGVMAISINEQIENFEKEKQQKADRMVEIMEKSAEEGRTLDAEETEEYDTLEGEIDDIEAHLKRLKAIQEKIVKTAAPVLDESGMQQREVGRIRTPLTVVPKLGKGIEFARYVMCLGAAKGDLNTAVKIAENRFADNIRVVNTLKSAVSAGTTTDPTWALPLVEYNQFAGDFVEYVRPRTIVGRFGVDGIPDLRRVPFNVHIRGQTSGGQGYWVGQSKPKPVTSWDYNDVYLSYAKVANIAVLSEELMRFSNPAAEGLVRDELANALIERMDIDFVDPDKAAEANVSPASISNGVVAIASSGVDAAAIREDVASALSTFIDASISATGAVWIMSATVALRLSLMRNALGQKEFPDITMSGGIFEGLPVITSEHVPTPTAGSYVLLVSCPNVWLSDDGNVVVEASREASLQMLDNPTNDSDTPTPTTLVSMFQTNSVAIKAERWINWKKRRDAAVAVISGVNWGETSSS